MERFEEKVIEGLASLGTKMEGLVEDVTEIRQSQKELTQRVSEIESQIDADAATRSLWKGIGEWIKPAIYGVVTFGVYLALAHSDIVKEIFSTK